MDKIRNLSGLAKANAIAILVFATVSFFGQIVVSHLYVLMPFGFAFLVGQGLTSALDDPEAEEPMPVWMRAGIGYGIGIAFGLGLLIVEYFITSHLVWVSRMQVK